MNDPALLPVLQRRLIQKNDVTQGWAEILDFTPTMTRSAYFNQIALQAERLIASPGVEPGHSGPRTFLTFGNKLNVWCFPPTNTITVRIYFAMVGQANPTPSAWRLVDTYFATAAAPVRLTDYPCPTEWTQVEFFNNNGGGVATDDVELSAFMRS